MPTDSLTDVEEEVLKHVFSISPDYAVSLGLHEYDGLLPTLSKRSVDSWIQSAEELLKRLKETDVPKSDQRRTLDKELLQMLLERGLFELKDLRVHIEDPITYARALNVQSYIIRDYAPAETRVRAITNHLRALPNFLKTALENLSQVLPKPHLKVAIDIANGTPANFHEAQALLDGVASSLRIEFEEAEKAAIISIEGFTKSLQDEYLPRAKDDFALGEQKLASLMRIYDRIDKPLGEVLEMGLRDIEQNKREFIETARRVEPSASPQEVMKKISLTHSTADSLIKDTASLLENIRQYIIERDLVTIPSEERCRVTETPTFARGVFTAAMDSPGPFETKTKQAFYYVTPVDSKWSEERQEEWLRYLNTASLKGISIHEAYPGHYVHFLHLKQLQTKASKAFFSYAFVEGWAHYCEEMLLQERYGDGDVGLKLAQLRAALVRDCRFICSIKMHTRQFTLEEATQYFMENAFVDRLPAEREALRGTFDPGYYSYTLGKLFIKMVRERYFAKKQDSGLKEFHDRMLGWGAPPVGFLEKLIN